MSFANHISNLHLDVLKEIGNIGAGHAATALSALLNKKIDMNVPIVRILTFDEMMDMAGGTENVVASVFLRIEGDVSGSIFFVLPLEQAESFIQQMIGASGVSFEHPPYDELAVSALQELGNILTGSYLTSLSDLTKLLLMPSVPAIGIDMAGAIFSNGLVELSNASDYAIIIDTALSDDSLQVTPRVQGQFFLLPDPESLQILFKALGVAEDE